jgi:hypothetical protein
MAEIITVRSLLPERDDGGYPVALYEADDQHPENSAGAREAFVAGPEPVEVARTGLVNRRISEGALEIVEDAGPKASRRAASAPAPAAPADPLGFLSAEQRAALASAGFDSPEAIRAATDEQLDAVDGIGEATVAKLREAVKE